LGEIILALRRRSSEGKQFQQLTPITNIPLKLKEQGPTYIHRRYGHHHHRHRTGKKVEGSDKRKWCTFSNDYHGVVLSLLHFRRQLHLVTRPKCFTQAPSPTLFQSFPVRLRPDLGWRLIKVVLLWLRSWTRKELWKSWRD